MKNIKSSKSSSISPRLDVPLPALLGSLLLVFSAPLHAALFVTNFTALTDTTGASGVWRNHTTATDLTFPVTLAQSGGTVRANDGSSSGSRIDNSFPWQPLPAFAGGINAFSPNFDGDYISVETPQGSTATITLEFNAKITNPVISFTDIEPRSTMAFTSPFTVLASTSNLSTTNTTLSSTGVLMANDPFGAFDEEAAGSIQFAGTFERIVFTVQVIAATGFGSNDRTGYVVSTTTEPTAVIPEPASSLYFFGASVLALAWRQRRSR